MVVFSCVFVWLIGFCFVGYLGGCLGCVVLGLGSSDCLKFAGALLEL